MCRTALGFGWVLIARPQFPSLSVIRFWGLDHSLLLYLLLSSFCTDFLVVGFFLKYRNSLSVATSQLFRISTARESDA